MFWGPYWFSFLPAGLNCQSQKYLSHPSSFSHLNLSKTSVIADFLDICRQLETFNSPCPLPSAVHGLPVLTCLQLYCMLLPPPASDVNPLPQLLSVQFFRGQFLSMKMERQCFLRPLPFISPVFPSDSTSPSSPEIQHCQQFLFYAQEVLSDYWMERKEKKKKKEHLFCRSPTPLHHWES